MSLRLRGKMQKERIDQCLVQIVNEIHVSGEQDIGWKQVSSILWKRFQINLDYKKCYNRHKNYLSPNVNPKLKLSTQQQDQVIEMHFCGLNNNEIRKKLDLKNVNENTLKNLCKVAKQTMGRVLRIIYEKNLEGTKIPKEFLKHPNQHFRIFLIVFSTSQLLLYYLRKGINILSLRKLTNQFDCAKKNFLMMKEGLQVKKKYETAMISYEKNIKDQIKTILGVYEDVLSDERKRDFLIGNKDKLLDDKFNYLKATILKIPLRVVQNQRNHCLKKMIDQKAQIPSFLEEDFHSNMESSHAVQGNLFQEWDQDRCRNFDEDDMWFGSYGNEYDFQADKAINDVDKMEMAHQICNQNSIQPTLSSSIELKWQALN